MTDNAARMDVEFKANPTQHRFITSRAQADLFSCRVGEGKSAALCWAIWYHTKHNPGARWAIVRDTYENVRDTTMVEFFKWFPDGVMGRFHKTEKTFTWTAEGLEGKVVFMGLDEEKDAQKLQSRVFAGFAFDEPAPAAESGGIPEFIFDTALTRLRQEGMKWYGFKLAQNNPDETHWTYTRFVDPGYTGSGGELPPEQEPGFRAYQTRDPENERNLPVGYYTELEAHLKKTRPDLVRRFVRGEYGFQHRGKAVTPEWSDDLHLADELQPIKGVPLEIGWDGGLNPTCTITQVTPSGNWLILECITQEGVGVYELIEDEVRSVLARRYEGFSWRHTGDPMLAMREQSSSARTAVDMIVSQLGGIFVPGPVKIPLRLDPLRAVLRRHRHGVGIVQVDRQWAKPVWHALRGGWHYHVARTGMVGDSPRKDVHSHPGDTMGYLAARLFPLGQRQKRRPRAKARSASAGVGLGFERPGYRLPAHGERLDGRKS